MLLLLLKPRSPSIAIFLIVSEKGIATLSETQKPTRQLHTGYPQDTGQLAPRTGFDGCHPSHQLEFLALGEDCQHVRTYIAHDHHQQFVTSSKVTPTQQNRVLQYCYGLLAISKILYRYKRVKSTSCPLCSGEDGGHHGAVSSCPALSKAVTLHHNDAGTAILKAFHQGCKGRLLLTSDVGWRGN
jgi:hypothetical protein